jgi:UDP-N-acetyl-D-galactosamine dehydrogenase
MTKLDSTIVFNGLGYVGLPLAVEFVKHPSTIGFDIDVKQILKIIVTAD